jgi:predicted dehydrogenase
MGKKLKLGIIGTGLAARNLHLPALIKLSGKIEVTAVCNHTEKKAKKFSQLTGGTRYYLNYKDLLKDPDVEAVDIALPIDLNYKVTIDSLKLGKHIFLEKPLAATMNEARTLQRLSTKYRSVMLLAENFRYRKVYNTLNQLLKEKSIGKVYAAQWNVFYRVTTDKDYGATKWRQNHKYPGGFMLDAGVHNVAALRLLFGEVGSVAAFTDSINPKIGRPDTMSIQMIFKSGVQVIYNLFFTVKHHWENKFLIFGTKGTIETRDDMISVKTNDKEPQSIDASDDGGYYNEFLDFYNGVRNQMEVRSSFSDGYEDMKVIFAALKSAETNKVIHLK